MLKKFEINDYITLKLEKDLTNLYINGELFSQCKYLLLNPVTTHEIEDFIENLHNSTIDIEADKYSNELELHNAVRIPSIQIEIKKKDEKLDKLYPLRQKINKPKTFCNLECFINYIKENTSNEIQTEIISSFNSSN